MADYNKQSTSRFSDRVDNYIKYRPGYPDAVIPYFIEQHWLTSNAVVIDVGSGTGISTELFLANGNTTYGVEPNDAMRLGAEQQLNHYDKFISIAGTAEQTTLETDLADIVIAGQAFHWFDQHATKEEFKRILKPGGIASIMWNVRKTETPFLHAYEQWLHQYASDYAQVDHRNVDAQKIQQFFAPNKVVEITFPNQQVFDFEGFKGRVLSSSYVPNQEHPNFEVMMHTLRDLFEAHQKSNTVVFEYDTVLFTGTLH